MRNKNFWANISLFNLCIVALLGLLLRSKFLFALPSLNYLKLLDAHAHFAFGGWLTLALLFLLTGQMLPEDIQSRPIYQRLFAGITLSSYGNLLTTLFINSGLPANILSALFIIFTYVFGWVFISDLRKTSISKTVGLLTTVATISLLLSSAGPITSAYLHAIKSAQPFYYRDASYFYLHLQYNGFFTTTVFALLFHKLFPGISEKARQSFYYFSVLLCISILPSLFLSLLWQDPNQLFRVIAIIGSVLVFFSVAWFIISALSLQSLFRIVPRVVRFIIFFSIIAFVLKMLLQSLTIFSSVGNAVFGDRPVIIGFLHLVFLGFVSPFILGFYTELGILHFKNKWTIYSLTIFVAAVIANELTLMLQGVASMFLRNGLLYGKVLWGISIGLLIGSLLIFLASFKSTPSPGNLQINRNGINGSEH